MQKKINLSLKIGFLIYFICILVFAFFVFLNKKKEILDNIKQKLKSSTNMAYALLGDDFLVHALEDKLPPKKIWHKVTLLTQYNFFHNITETGVEALINNDVYDLIGGLKSKYNLEHHIRVVDGGDVYRFNLSKHNPKSAKDWPAFINSKKKEMYKILTGGTGTQYLTYYKHIYLSNGEKCVVFANIDISEIDAVTFKAVKKALFVFLIFILLAIPILILLRLNLIKNNKELEDAWHKTDNAQQLKLEAERQKEMAHKERDNAKQANETKDQFFANMNHDFRTPLNAIIGYSELISSAPNDTLEVVDQSNKIHKNAKIMLNFTEDLLDYIRLKNNSLEYVEEIVNLNTTIKYIYASFSLRVMEDGKFLDVELDPKLPLAIESSNRRIFQIINNLVSNAIKFTEKGDEISVKIKKKNENEFYIIVKDSGIGIEKSKQADIFEEFKKLDNKNNGSGVGLGLFITKSIVQIMGGTISVDSKENEYTEFVVTIPLKEMKQNFEVENIYEKLLERKNAGDSIECFHNQLKEYIEDMAGELHEVLNKLPFVENVYDLIFPLTHKRKTSSKLINFDEAVYYLEKANYEAKENNDREKVEKYLNLTMDLIDKIPYLKVNQIQPNETISIKEKQVLIVDDAKDNSTILQKKLSTIGLGADIADSGKMALEMLKEKQYEVIVYRYKYACYERGRIICKDVPIRNSWS